MSILHKQHEEDRMAMMAGSSQGGLANDMNVTPLIDVLLVLLIIFMIITPLTPMGENARAPQPSDSRPHSIAEPRTVVVQVIDTGSAPALKINDEDATWDTLQTRLKDIFKSRAERVVFVSADASLDFDPVARVISAAHGAGVDNVGLMTAKVAGRS